MKLLVTSCPELDIKDLFQKCSASAQEYVVGGGKEWKDELSLYLDHRLAGIITRFPNLNEGWPGETRKSALIEQSAGLFLWTEIACDFVGDTVACDPDGRLQQILSQSPGESTGQVRNSLDRPEHAGLARFYLGQLYRQVLERNVPETHRLTFMRVLGAIIVYAKPVRPQVLASILASGTSNEHTRIPSAHFDLVLQSLAPVIRKQLTRERSALFMSALSTS